VSDNKSTTPAGTYLTILLAIGIVAVVLGIVIAAAGGTSILFFVVGGILIVAWLIIKAAKN
jgi:hypothetical protein